MSLFNFSKKPKNDSVSSPVLAVGQEWHYQTRIGEENSTIKIVKIENYEEIGKLIHISILGLKMRHPKFEGGILKEVMHLPISELALTNCITHLKNNHTNLPDYEFGYVRWKTAFDDEKAGYFAIPLQEVVKYLEDSANK
ncbi:hypothetical protein [Sphingobacterium kyonggiense]